MSDSADPDAALNAKIMAAIEAGDLNLTATLNAKLKARQDARTQPAKPNQAAADAPAAAGPGATAEAVGKKIADLELAGNVVDFQASETFTGTKSGYVYKMGDQGLGYYADEHGKLLKALHKAEAKMDPQAAQSRIVDSLGAVPAAAVAPVDDTPSGEALAVAFTAAKWGISARMTGGPVVVTKVKAGGNAAELGVQVGDVITDIAGINVFRNRSVALTALRTGGEAEVKLVRPAVAERAVAVVPGGGGGGGGMKAVEGSVEVAPESVKELSAMIGGAKAMDTVTVAGQTGVTKTFDDDSFGANHTLVIFNCVDCNYTIENYALKVFMQGCKNVTVTFNGKILTATLELFKCQGLTLAINTTVGTVQADDCDGLDVTFGKKEDFHMCVWAGCERLKLGFGDADDSVESGFADVSSRHANLSYERSQFKISKVNGKAIQEPIIRLANGFTTTAREKAVFDTNQEKAVQMMAKTMGISIKPGKKGVKVKPNQTCPCGTGQKVKKCCPHAAQSGWWMAPEAAEPLK